MALFDDLKLNDAASNDADATEQAMLNGNRPPEGIQHAVLNGCRERTTPNTGTRLRELTFVVLAGAGKGKEVTETIWLPNGEDAEKDAKKTQRLRMFCHRLGLLKKVKVNKVVNGKKIEHEYQPVEGKTDFLHCLGTAVFVEVEHEDEVSQKDGKKYKRAKLSYEGIIPDDDKRVKDLPRGNPGDAAAGILSSPSGPTVGGGPVTSTAAAGKGSRDFSDLM